MLGRGSLGRGRRTGVVTKAAGEGRRTGKVTNAGGGLGGCAETASRVGMGWDVI